MLQTKLFSDKNRLWSEAKRTHELLFIAAKQQNHFDGEVICAEDVEA